MLNTDQTTQVQMGTSFAREMQQVFVDWLRELPILNRVIPKDPEQKDRNAERLFNIGPPATGGHMFKDNGPPAGSLPQSTQGEDAVFKGWQKTGSGEVFALYNITAAGHPSLGSTVSEKTLHKLNLQAPGVPLPEGHMKMH